MNSIKNKIKLSDYKFALDESAIVAITDQHGIIKHVNDKFCEISKYTRKELIGQDHRIINSGHHSKIFIHALWVTIANGKTWRGEIKNKAKDGSFYWVDTTIVPFLDEQGKPFKYLSIRSDITERKRIEMENNEHMIAIEEMVFMISHKVRKPIVNILGLANILNESMEPIEVRKIVEFIKQSALNLDILTHELNDFIQKTKNKNLNKTGHNIG